MIGSNSRIGSIGNSAKRVGSIGKADGATGDALSTGVSGNFSRVHWPTTTSTYSTTSTQSTTTSSSTAP